MQKKKYAFELHVSGTIDAQNRKLAKNWLLLNLHMTDLDKYVTLKAVSVKPAPKKATK